MRKDNINNCFTELQGAPQLVAAAATAVLCSYDAQLVKYRIDNILLPLQKLSTLNFSLSNTLATYRSALSYLQSFILSLVTFDIVVLVVECSSCSRATSDLGT